MHKNAANDIDRTRRGFRIDAILREPVDGSSLEREFAAVAEVAVGEAVEEAEAGDAVECCRESRDADRGNVLVDTKQRNLDRDQVNRMRARECAKERRGFPQ